MKQNIIVILLGILALTSFGQSKSKVVTSNIKVYGNCGMCKERIEGVLERKGIKKATWDASTKNLNVVFVPSKISEQQICQLVASAGHDTDTVKAKDEVYAELPFCCLYRDHDHSGMEDGKKNDH